MEVEVLHEAASQLETWLRIPDSEQDILKFITAGFSSASVETRCNLGAPSNQIISLTILATRLACGQL